MRGRNKSAEVCKIAIYKLWKFENENAILLLDAGARNKTKPRH